MFDNYTYRQKCVGLVLTAVLLSGAAYKRSFGPLLEILSENDRLMDKAKNLNYSSDSVDILSKELAILDRSLGKENVTKEEIQQGIVSFTAKYPGISISRLHPSHVFQNENYAIVTNQLDVTGSMELLLKLGYAFEKEFLLSRTVSLDFYTEKKNKSELLHLKIIFQNYESIK
jgi:hypothetical protein